MNQVIDMMLKYPSILPLDPQHTRFQGYLTVNDVDYQIFIKQQDGKLTLEMNQQLQQFDQEISGILQSANCTNIVKLLDDLKAVLASKTTSKALKNPAEVYRLVLNEYVELREFYISMHKCTISQDLSEIQMSHQDESCRVHDISVSVDVNGGSNVFRVKGHSLPEKKGVELFHSCSSLKAIYEKFVAIVDKLQDFFNIMDRLDDSCWVLDPEKPTRKDQYRRIGLDVNVSLIIDVDPWTNADIPNIKFLGPERLTEKFRQKVAENIEHWNPRADVVQEILKLLEMPGFPPPLKSSSEDEILLCNVGECCICFSLRINEKLPDIICQNASCEQLFHRECLYQWLISVSAKQSFNELHGHCPNCEKHISCPI